MKPERSTDLLHFPHPHSLTYDWVKQLQIRSYGSHMALGDFQSFTLVPSVGATVRQQQ